MTKVNANNFIQAWKNYVKDFTEGNNELIGDYLKNWNENNFGNNIIGNQKYGKKECPLGDALVTFFGGDIDYRTEYNKIDLLVAKKQFFKIKNFNTDPIKENYGFYPIIKEIVIEHEKNIITCWQEMIKLVYDRARLKVLITYLFSEKHRKDPDKYISIVKQNFTNIITQANDFSENESTQYVLIIGQADYKNDKKYLIWNIFIFDEKGTTDAERDRFKPV